MRANITILIKMNGMDTNGISKKTSTEGLFYKTHLTILHLVVHVSPLKGILTA